MILMVYQWHRLWLKMNLSEQDWGPRVDFKLALGTPVKVYPALSLGVQTQWDAVDIWQRSREENTVDNQVSIASLSQETL